MLVFYRDWLVISAKQFNLFFDFLLLLGRYALIHPLTLLKLYGVMFSLPLQLLDRDLMVREGSVAKLDPVPGGGSGLVVGGEPQGVPLAVAQAAGEGVGGVSDPGQ